MVTLCITLEMPEDIVCWIQVTSQIQHFEVEGLYFETPVPNPRRGFGTRAVEDG